MSRIQTHALPQSITSTPLVHHRAIELNKAELIEHVATTADISKASAARAVDAMLEGIGKALREAEQVAIAGFGTFDVRARAARMGRNPKTGEALSIAAARIPTFKAGKALRDSIN